jgi:uncharacterized protein
MTDNELLPEFVGFFANARQGRLCFPHCRACSRFHWYPMPRCPHCQSADWRWQQVSGAGEIYSFTKVRHAFDRSRRDQLPYAVALVTFANAPGVRLITNIVGADASDLRIGEPVEPVFPAPDDAINRVLFRQTSRDRSARP